MPCFSSKKLPFGFAANTARNHVDIGARTPGLIIDLPDMCFAEVMCVQWLSSMKRANAVRACGVYIIKKKTTRVPNLVMGILRRRIASPNWSSSAFRNCLVTFTQGKPGVFQTTRQRWITPRPDCCSMKIDPSIPDGDLHGRRFPDDKEERRSTPRKPICR